MGERTGVNWTGATYNPWHGCHKVSQGCAKCYMFRDKERYGQDPNKVVRSKAATFDAPLKWQREAERGDRVGHDRLVFTCSWSDFFVKEADPWRGDAWHIIAACPLLTFQVLTKRIERWRRCWWLEPVPGHVSRDEGDGKRWVCLPNVWLGVSVEDQMAADERIPHLFDVPATVRFLSVEPILGPVDLTNGLAYGYRWDYLTGEQWSAALARRPLRGVDWVIVGGESGHARGRYAARPCDVAHVRSLVAQCKAAGVPCWVKQLGSKPYDSANRISIDGPESHGVAIDLRDKHGEDWSEWDADLRVREMPEVSAHA